MAYTSVLPVHRLERSIDYVKDRTKTTKSAGSLEEAIDYACNREKTEETIFEDAMGCTCENAYADMVKTKERLSHNWCFLSCLINSLEAKRTFLISHNGFMDFQNGINKVIHDFFVLLNLTINFHELLGFL